MCCVCVLWGGCACHVCFVCVCVGFVHVMCVWCELCVCVWGGGSMHASAQLRPGPGTDKINFIHCQHFM